MSLHRRFFKSVLRPYVPCFEFQCPALLMRRDIDGLPASLPPVSAYGLMFSSLQSSPPNTRNCLLPETHAYYMPVMKIQYPLIRDTIWCSFACEVLGVACYLDYGVFLDWPSYQHALKLQAHEQMMIETLLRPLRVSANFLYGLSLFANNLLSYPFANSSRAFHIR